MASLDLDAISFVVKTEQLDTAITKLEKLETSLGNLSKPLKETTVASEKLAQAQAKTAQAQSKAEEAANKAATAQAKIAQAQSKAEEAANKAAIAQTRLEKATSSATTSQGKLNKATDESLDKAKALQEKLANTYKDLSQGYTKGESSVLNYARSIGVAEDALKPFQDQLKLIGKLSTDPFDSAIGSIRSITKEFEMMNHRTDLANKGIVLSAKQLKEYSRIADEVAAKITVSGLDPTQGKGLADYTKEVETLQAKYLGLASTVSNARQAEVANQNALKEAATANERAIKSSATASEWLAKEILRAENAANGLSEELSISTSNKLTRFAEQLKLSGVSAEEAVRQLKDYESILSVTSKKSVKELPQDSHVATYYKQQEKAANDAAKANDYLTREMLRAEAALAGLNENMNISSSNRLLRFKEALSAAGVEAGQAALALQKYEAVLKATDTASANKKTKNRKEELEYLARATSVQLGDIGVSLAGGQNPLIVMIQQGDQLRGVLNQVGGDAKEMQAAMSSAFRQIVVGFVDVGKALGQFVTGAFVDASKAIVNYALDVLRVNKALEYFKEGMKSLEGDTNKITASIGRLGTSMLNLIAPVAFASAVTGIAGFTAALVASVAAMYQLGKEQTTVAQANAQFGGAFGASTQDILKYNEQLSKLNVSSGQAASIFVEVAKAGNIGKDSFVEITKAAADFEKYVGGKAADAVKVYSEVIKDPVKGLTDLGVQTGFVTTEQIQLVETLLKSNKGLEATEIAVKAVTGALSQMTQEAKDNMSALDFAIISAKEAISGFWNELKNSSIVKSFAEGVAGISFVVNALLITLRAVPGSIAGVIHDSANALSIYQGKTKSMLATLGSDYTAELDKAAQTHATFIAKINGQIGSRKKDSSDSDAVDSLRKKRELYDYLSKSDKDTLTRQEYIKKNVEEWNKKLGTTVMTEKELLDLQKKLGAEWDKAHKQKKDPTESFFASSIKTFADDTAKAIGAQEQYTKAQVDFLKIASNPKWLELSESERIAISRKAELAIARELEAKQISEVRKQEEALQSLIDKSMDAQKRRDEARELAFESDIRGYSDKLKLTQEESEDLLLQKKIYGQASEQQKISIEYAKVKRDLEKEILKIKEKQAKGEYSESQAASAITIQEDIAEARRKNILDASALETYKSYHDAFANAIETGLLQSGKEAGVNLRKFLETELLRKPFRVFINAAVDLAMSSLGIAGSAASGAAGASFIGSSSALSLGAQGGFGALLNGGGFEAIGSAFTAITEGTMASFAAGLGTLAGVLGPIAGVAMLLSSLDDSGTYHTGGLGSYSLAGGSATGNTVKTQGLDFNLASEDYQASTEQASVALAKGIVEILDSTAKTFGNEAGYYAATAFADDTSKDGAWGALMVKLGDQLVIDWKQGTDKWPGREFADGEAGVKEYQAALAKDMRQVLLDMDLPDWANDVLSAIGEDPSMEDLTAAMQRINDMPAAILTSIGTSSEALSDIIMLGMQNSDPIGAGQAFADQITYGIENSLYQGFAQQITSIISTQLVTPVVTAMAKGATITEAMSKASVNTMLAQVKAAGQAFAAIVNDPEFKAALAEVNNTIAGAVSGGIGGFTAPTAPGSYADKFSSKETKDPIKEAKEEVDKSAENLKKSLESLNKEQQLLQAEYNDLVNGTKEVVTITRANTIATYEGTAAQVAEQVALYDSNQALRDKIELYKKEKAALGAFWNAVEQNLERFLTGDDLRLGKTTFLAQTLNKAGVGTGNYLDDARSLMQYSPNQIKQLAAAFVLSADNSVEAKTAVLGVVGSLIDLAEAADTQATTALVKLYDTLQANAVSATDKAFAVLEKSISSSIKNIEDEQKIIEESLSTKEKARDTIKEVFDVLKTSVENLYKSVTSTNKAEVNKASKFIGDALLTALQTGVLPDAKDLEKAIGLVTADLDATQFKTKFEADKQRLLLANMLNEFKGLSDNQLTDAEKQLVVLKDQLTNLEQLKTAANDQLAYWEKQVALARDTWIEAGNITKAIDNLAIALGVEVKTKELASQNVMKGAYNDQAVYNVKAQTGTNSSGESFKAPELIDAAKLHIAQGGSAQQIYDVIRTSGYSLTQAEQILGATPGSFAAAVKEMNDPLRPSFDVGTNYVPHDMIAQIHEGEMIVPKAYNPSAGGAMSSNNNDAIEMMRHELRAIAINTAKLERMIDRVIVPTPQGEALQTTTVTA